MITPRRTRLLRVPTLRGMHDVLTGVVAALDATTAGDTWLIVPTRAAAEQLRRTVEDRLLETHAVIWWPQIGPRADFYRALAARAPAAPPVLSGFDREILMSKLARAVIARGVRPPFALRPAIVAEMVALYDHIRRQARSVEDFARNLRAELEPSADTDRGAAQLLQQTAFLGAVFDAYDAWLSEGGHADEHTLRARLLDGGATRPVRQVLVAVGDRVGDPDGLWPVDVTLLSALPDLVALDIVATEAQLAAGFLERIHAALPGLEEVPDAGASLRREPAVTWPRVMAPAPSTLVTTARDREDELAGIARRLKQAHRTGGATPLARQALVVRQPLPYLYLARSVFDGAGVPFETLDTLPLAAEPYAAAMDLVLDAAVTGFTRTALVGLLRSPHFDFAAPGAPLNAAAVSALDGALADARFLGGLDRLIALHASWQDVTSDAGREGHRRRRAMAALEAAVQIARELSPLTESRPAVAQLAVLQQFLERHHRAADDGSEPVERTARVRHAVVAAIRALAGAYEAHDPDAEAAASDLSSTIRRWLGAQTFATRVGGDGLRILDTQAARFADLDEVQVLGLVAGEWPEPVRRNIFYPPSLLGLIEPVPAADDPNRREGAMLAAARASFQDLLLLAHQRVRASTFLLEADAVVEPSPFVDELTTLGLTLDRDEPIVPAVVFVHEGLLATPPLVERLTPVARGWAELRRAPAAAAAGDPRYLGEAGPWVLPRVSVSRVDRYLKCPFQFFASEVLRLDEEPEDVDRPPPWERGRFLHAIFEVFFREWQQRGHRQIPAARVPEARLLLTEVCERALATLSSQDAALERARLFGSAAGAGIVDRVLALEADRPAEVERRLIEFELDAPFRFRGEPGTEPREVRLRAKVDRVDLLADRTFRVIDYKSKVMPDLRRSVQLQVYTSAVAQQLARGGDPREPVEACYLSFEGEPPVRPLRPAKGQSLDDVLAGAEARMVQALNDIAAGHFPARPTPRSLCNTCPFDSVCRKAFVEANDD